jgi:hypothetical protein
LLGTNTLTGLNLIDLFITSPRVKILWLENVAENIHLKGQGRDRMVILN